MFCLCAKCDFKVLFATKCEHLDNFNCNQITGVHVELPIPLIYMYVPGFTSIMHLFPLNVLNSRVCNSIVKVLKLLKYNNLIK